ACIDSSSYTSKLILKYRQFVINIIGKNTMRDLIYCGKVSGSDTDKFSKTKLKPVKSKTIKPPYIKESIGHIECSLYYRKEFEGVNLFVGSVKYCEVDEKYYDGNLISEKAKTPHHLGSRIFFFSGRRIKVGE
ncbi:MAG: flavin reductase family protein, partial [Elusimicrobiota bacterium]